MREGTDLSTASFRRGEAAVAGNRSVRKVHTCSSGGPDVVSRWPLRLRDRALPPRPSPAFYRPTD